MVRKAAHIKEKDQQVWHSHQNGYGYWCDGTHLPGQPDQEFLGSLEKEQQKKCQMVKWLKMMAAMKIRLWFMSYHMNCKMSWLYHNCMRNINYNLNHYRIWPRRRYINRRSRIHHRVSLQFALHYNETLSGGNLSLKNKERRQTYRRLPHA